MLCAFGKSPNPLLTWVSLLVVRGGYPRWPSRFLSTWRHYDVFHFFLWMGKDHEEVLSKGISQLFFSRKVNLAVIYKIVCSKETSEENHWDNNLVRRWGVAWTRARAERMMETGRKHVVRVTRKRPGLGDRLHTAGNGVNEVWFHSLTLVLDLLGACPHVGHLKKWIWKRPRLHGVHSLVEETSIRLHIPDVLKCCEMGVRLLYKRWMEAGRRGIPD